MNRTHDHLATPLIKKQHTQQENKNIKTLNLTAHQN